MDIMSIAWAIMFALTMVQWSLERAYRKLRREHDVLAKTTFQGLYELGWSEIREAVANNASAYPREGKSTK